MTRFSLNNIPTLEVDSLVEGAVKNLWSFQISSPAMELPHHGAGKGDQSPSILTRPHSRQSLRSMSRGWVEDVRHHLLTTVTQDLALATGNWGRDEKC